MPDLTRVVIGAGVELPVQDKTGAHARAESQENHVAAAAPGTILPFRERTRVRVILQGGANARRLLYQFDNGNVVPAGEVGRRLHDTRPAVQGTAARDADSLGIGPVQAVAGGHRLHFRKDAADGLVHVRGFKADLVRNLQLSVRINAIDDGTLRTADIDTQEVLFHIL